MNWPIPIPRWFWLWAQWRLGRGPYKGHAMDPAVRPAEAPAHIPTWAWSRLRALLNQEKPQPVTMYDSVDVSRIPPDAAAVAGYVNGRYQTFPELEQKFPDAHRLSIAVTSQADADCLDVEPGDATPGVAPVWFFRQQARGLKKPVFYTSVSAATDLKVRLSASGISRDEYRLWTAHYTGVPHLCSSKCWPGFNDNADATQYDNDQRQNLDTSLCSPGFFEADT